MFSSASDQFSYQSSVLSHFTKSFIDSVITYSGTELRYKHIIDYISDEFDKNSLQKPLFVTQASFTEIFCRVNRKMKTLLSDQMRNLLVLQKSEAEATENLSLVDLVIEDSKRYCSQEEVTDSINNLRTAVVDYQYCSELDSLYSVEIDFEEEYGSTSIEPIGFWLRENEHRYFSKVEYQREKLPASNSPFSIALSNFISTYEETENKNYKNVISGFDLTVDVPFKLISIDARPKYPNINWCECKIAFVFSQVELRFFYKCSTFQTDGWEEYSHDTSSEWQTVEAEFKGDNQPTQALATIMSEFESFVMNPLKAKYILTVEGVQASEDGEELLSKLSSSQPESQLPDGSAQCDE